MASIVEKKFDWFEQHIRANLKERTLASPKYTRIPSEETDKFLVFYLRILLDKIDMMENHALAKVPDTDRAAPRLGYRTSVPVPKGGVGAIKAGKVPDLNLDTLIDETIEGAIESYLAAVATSPDLSRELESQKSLTLITRSELRSLEIPIIKAYAPIYTVFHLCNYLSPKNVRFINPLMISNVKKIHDFVNNNGFFFPLKNNGSKTCVSPSDWINVRTGILPLGVFPDLPKDIPNLLNKFRQGNAVQYILTEFHLTKIEEMIGKLESYYGKYYDILNMGDTKVINDSAANMISEFLDIREFYQTVVQHLVDFNNLKKIEPLKSLIPLYEAIGKCFNSFFLYYNIHSHRTLLYIEESLFTMEYEGYTFQRAYDKFINFLDIQNGEVKNVNPITVENPETHQTTVVYDPRDEHFANVEILRGACSTCLYFSKEIHKLTEVKTALKEDNPSFEVFADYDFDEKYNEAITAVLVPIDEKEDVTSENLLKIKSHCDTLLDKNAAQPVTGSDYSIKQGLIHLLNKFATLLQSFHDVKDDLLAPVNSDFIENNWNSYYQESPDYSVKSYKGTLICYKIST